MKTKKLLSVVLSIFLIVCALPLGVNAADSIEIKASSAECLPGETVVVTIDLSNNPGISSLKLKVVYDDALTLESVDYNPEMGGQSIQPQTMSSPATLLWLSPFEDYEADATFATLTFTVAEDAKPFTAASIRLTYNPEDIYNMAEENIPCLVTNGKISVNSIYGEDAKYIESTENTTIDYSNQIIFSEVWCEKEISNIVDISDINSINAQANSSDGFIGTGSTLVINKGDSTAHYSIIILGDLNGDSVCDALDAAVAYFYSAGLKEPTENEILAANGCAADEIDVNDYQSIVNWALS